MSHKATHWAWTVRDISSAEKLTLLALADRHNADTGQCFPSLDKIADDTSLSRDTVRRATQSLEQKGLLSRRLVLDEHGRTLGYSYGLHMGDSTLPPLGSHHATPEGSTMPPKPVIITSKEKPISCSKQVRASQSEDFNKFWLGYPRKVGKGAAEKAWVKAVQSTEASVIIASLGSHKFSEDINYIPHPATWLNQRRWEDVPTVGSSPAAPTQNAMVIPTPEANFPPDGSVEYTPWASRIRAHNTGHDPDWIANRFRDFCRSKNIAFNSPHIVKALDGFTRAQKRV